jgi:hypothetical protein
MRGCKRIYIQSFLDEFIWRHNNSLERGENVEKRMYEQISRTYQAFKSPGQTV